MVLLSVKRKNKENSNTCRKGGDNNEKKTCNACSGCSSNGTGTDSMWIDRFF